MNSVSLFQIFKKAILCSKRFDPILIALPILWMISCSKSGNNNSNVLTAQSQFDHNAGGVYKGMLTGSSGYFVIYNTFGGNGIVTFGEFFGDPDVVGYSSDEAYSLSVQPDGKIIVAGLSSSQATSGVYDLLRINSDGSLDNSFGQNGIIHDGFGVYGDNAIALQQDGKILVAGAAETIFLEILTILE